jgi:hypothetical protein
MQKHKARLIAALGTVVTLALAGCNPTWTKDGAPNDSSMPVPPGGTPPSQTAPAEPSGASASKP